MSDKPKFCVDCKWFRHKPWTLIGPWTRIGRSKWGTCVAPCRDNPHSLVSPEIHNGKLAVTMRNPLFDCGPAGKLWEAQ